MLNNVSSGSAKAQKIDYNSLSVETQTKGKAMSKRMQLKLDDETYELIKELSELSGMSASSLVTVMFQISREDFRQLITRIEVLGKKPYQIFDSVVGALERSGYQHRGALSTRRSKNSKGSDEK